MLSSARLRESSSRLSKRPNSFVFEIAARASYASPAFEAMRLPSQPVLTEISHDMVSESSFSYLEGRKNTP
jgi:hypothetical protein